MKRLAALLLCMTFLLSGCALPQTASSAPPELEIEETVSGQLRKLRPDWSGGVYVTANTRAKQSIYAAIDYKHAAGRILCTVPGCTHQDESCPALSGIWDIPVAPLILDREHLLYLCLQRETGTTVGKIAEVDGSEVQELFRLSMSDLHTMQFYTDNAYLYLVNITKMEDGYGQYFQRVPLEGGPVETLFPLEHEDEWVECIDALGRSMMALKYRSDAGKHTLVLLDVDTDREEVMRELGSAIKWCYDADQQTLYWIDKSDWNIIHWITMQGNEGELAADLADNKEDWINEIELERVIDNQLLFTRYRDGRQRMAVDLNTGTVRELTLSFMENGEKWPLRILAESEDELLVEFEEQDHKVSYLDEYHRPVAVSETLNRYAMISIEDFFANRVRYREIKMDFLTQIY